MSSVIVPEGEGRWAEYAGGYSDMLAQRGADLICQAPRREPQKLKLRSRSSTQKTAL